MPAGWQSARMSSLQQIGDDPAPSVATQVLLGSSSVRQPVPGVKAVEDCGKKTATTAAAETKDTEEIRIALRDTDRNSSLLRTELL